MRRCLLDSSFVIDWVNEVAAKEKGPAMAWFRKNPRCELWVSPVTYAEVLEGAADVKATRELLGTFRWQTIGRHHAERAALFQSRSANGMGENDAWQVAIADAMNATIVGHDPKAFDRLRDRYDDHRIET
jgi:predicted nucleic acid-binding protein